MPFNNIVKDVNPTHSLVEVMLALRNCHSGAAHELVGHTLTSALFVGAERFVGRRLPGHAEFAAGGSSERRISLRAFKCHLRAEAAAGLPES